ncbi:MAG TPA: hypothetical protein VFW50_17935 [Streptosporangiaceae bacterium]|nr:hypothetical protein [Streptosporangiaceae bacterium]
MADAASAAIVFAADLGRWRHDNAAVTRPSPLHRCRPDRFDGVTTISLLRDAARSRNLRLSDLARALADGTETDISLTTGPRSRPSTGHFHGAKAASKSRPAV